MTHTKWSEIKRRLDPRGTANATDREYVMAVAEDAFQRGYDQGWKEAHEDAQVPPGPGLVYQPIDNGTDDGTAA